MQQQDGREKKVDLLEDVEIGKPANPVYMIQASVYCTVITSQTHCCWLLAAGDDKKNRTCHHV